MKVGSLVEFTGCKLKSAEWIIKPNPPVKGEVYTVRELVKCPVKKTVCLRVEEKIFGYNTDGDEMAARVSAFRELQPPMSLEFIQELQIETNVPV